MPFNTERTAAFYDKEILKYPKGFEAIRNAVIVSSSVSANGDGRYIVEAGTVMCKYAGVAAVQHIDIANATDGTFDITFDGETASNLDHDVSTANLQTALRGLSNIGASDVVVSGSPGAWIVTFAANMAPGPQPLLSVDGTDLIGTGVTVDVHHATVGISTLERVRPAASSGEQAADVVGILAYNVELYGNTSTQFDEPVALFFDDCIFNASALINYSGNASNVKTALASCSFE